MRVEALHLTEGADDGLGLDAAFAVETNDAGAALKHVGRDAGEGFAGTTGGQRVAGTGEEIAHGDGRVIAEKDRTGSADEWQDGIFACGDEREVLRRKIVHKVSAFLQTRHKHAEDAFFEHWGQLGLATERL